MLKIFRDLLILAVVACGIGGGAYLLTRSPLSPSPRPAPVPHDPLTAKLQAAFDADTSLAKAGQKLLLTDLCRVAAKYSQNPKLVTMSDLFSDYKGAAETMLLPGVLTALRKDIAAELAASLGGNPAALLDDAARKKAGDTFARLALSLEKVK